MNTIYSEKRYLLELEDRIEEGVVELLTSKVELAINLWQSISIDSQLSLYLLGMPKSILIGGLPKNDPLFYKIQPNSEVDLIILTCEYDLSPNELKHLIKLEAKTKPDSHPSWWSIIVKLKLLEEGRLIWPPKIKQLSAVEVKAAYALEEIKEGSLSIHGLTNKKLKKVATQCNSLLLMGFDLVSMLVGIVTEPQGGIKSQPWMNAAFIGTEAFNKAKPFLESLPKDVFGVAAWSIGAIGGPLSFIPKNKIPKGEHPLKIDPSKKMLFRKSEKFAGAGEVKVIRPALKNNQISQPKIKILKECLHKNLTNILRDIPKPTSLPAVLRWNIKNQKLIYVKNNHN